MTKFIMRCSSIAIMFAFVAIIALPMLSENGVALAQNAADTPIPEPVVTSTPTPTPIPVVTAVPTPVPPTQIPEPVTVILFGSGLAALSASVAKKRKKQ